MCSVGSGMVLAISDLAGATVVTLLAATASSPEWVAMDVTGAVIELRAMVPVGSPRKSAAIIPFVNKTLTSELPIGSGGKCLMILATWLHSG